MRSLIPMCSLALVACGIFGSTDGSHVDESASKPDAASDEADAALPAVGSPAPLGIYVSASRGRDDGDGSSTGPLKTLTRALAVAKDFGLPVIACAEQYPEALVLVDGVSAFGYYDCTKTPWERGVPRAVVLAPTSPAVLASGIVAPTRVVGFDIHSPDLDSSPATEGSGTSVALEIRASKGVSFAECLLHAGKGAPGTDGVPGLPNARTPASNGAAGVDQHERTCPPLMIGGTVCSAIRINGSTGGTTTCTIGPSGGPGGAGGDGRIWLNRQMGTQPGEQRGAALVATTSTAVGGLNTDSGGLGVGLKGSVGAPGADGPDGINGAWSLSSMGFTRGTGTVGGVGNPGQGGGGGGGTGTAFTAAGAISPPSGSMVYATATGGGGGGGGCGGQPGTPGSGGGASIGALVIDSVVSFEHARIETAAGGRGGKGNLGTTAVAGGTGGLGTVVGVDRTGAGGAGGAGGEGGASGHGAPGPSIALAYSNARPTTIATDLVPGPAGGGQPALTRSSLGGSGMKTLPAIAGDSLQEYVIPR
jgi:hypothetical protein